LGYVEHKRKRKRKRKRMMLCECGSAFNVDTRGSKHVSTGQIVPIARFFYGSIDDANLPAMNTQASKANGASRQHRMERHRESCAAVDCRCSLSNANSE
jgi:CDGSH-type Zn-finger protein